MLKKAKKRTKNFELVMEDGVLRIKSKGTEKTLNFKFLGKTMLYLHWIAGWTLKMVKRNQ